MNALSRRFAELPTAAKLLLILAGVLLPIGIALYVVASNGMAESNSALKARSDDQAMLASRAMESLVARNALALKIAANGGLASNSDPCAYALRSLAIAPAVARHFEIRSVDGTPVCVVGDVPSTDSLPPIAPGNTLLRIAPSGNALLFRVGVNGGMATGVLPISELRLAAESAPGNVEELFLRDPERSLSIIPGTGRPVEPGRPSVTRWPIVDNSVIATVTGRVRQLETLDRLLLLLPVVMWVIAALLTWLMVSRLLIRPLKSLQRAVSQYQPGDVGLDLPQKLGPATEIQALRDAFGRAVARIEDSEREMTGALEGQRRLVREVHHRVKNNLQVVASLLNIHGRTANGPDARAAYASIGRRVGALSVVHRNHFAEMEENRGIALRPLLSELSAELRAGAPEQARSLVIDLDVDTINTTQDVAVSVAFLVTEMVEFAMLGRPNDLIEISLRRTSELTARLTIASPVLVPDEDGSPDKQQFERIIGGLAKQLRSNLDRKLGRYSVEIPAFPPN